nr:hypothetical protein [Kofleriaceae bacterium]
MVFRDGLAAIGLVAALAATAAADPGFAWRAPAQCPDAADARARIERRLGGQSMDHYVVGVTVDIAADPEGYVAHVGGRTLTSATCDDLTDAVALVVARIAVAAPAAEQAYSDEAIVPTEVSTIAAPHGRWTASARVSFVSGVGSVPDVGIGGEVAVVVQRDRVFGELAGSTWESSAARLASGAPGGVDVQLRTLTVRGGYAAISPLRGWVVVDVGSMAGQGVALQNEQMGSGPWLAAGAGFGVAWPIARAVRVVGTFEVLAELQHRTTFDLGDGQVVYQPAPATARTSFGLEIGWP